MKSASSRITISYMVSALACLFIVCTSSSYAAIPGGINYQAYLTNTDGSPVDTTVTITFAAYNADVGGVPLWNETQSVTIEQGLFTLTLGNPTNPFPAGLFDDPVFVGMFIAGEELLPRRALNSSAYAFKASDADTLDGADATDLDQSADVAGLQSDVAGIASDVSAVASDVATNDGRIFSLEASAGDITGVSAGAGLTGGGAAGNVSLGIASGGVVAGMIGVNSVSAAALQAGSVGSAQIADGAVGPIDLDNTANYQMAGLTTSGAANLLGPVTFDSFFDVRIHDDVNALRWYKSNGTTQMASITVSDSQFDLFDHNYDRSILKSRVNGISMGGAEPVSGYDVTVASLSVIGSIDLGRTVVASTFDLSSTTPQCHSHGNLPCYYGTGLATCPIGTTAIGGGTSAGTARYGSVSHSFPSGSSSWFCGASYDLEDTTRNCYVVCARIQ